MLQILLVLGILAGAGVLASLRSTASEGVVYLACTRLPQEVPLLYPAGTRLVRVAGKTTEPLEGFELNSAPRTSYDGSRIVFSARRSEEVYAQIWEADSNGKVVSQRTRTSSHNVTPDYLPDGRIAFARLMEGADQGPSQGNIFVLDESGAAQQISFGNELYLVDHVLEDGRILVRRLTPRDHQGLELALRPDGTEMERYLATAIPVSETAELPVRSQSFVPGGRISLDPGGEFEIQSSVRMEPRTRPPVATSVVNEDLDYGWLLCLDVRQTDLDIDLEGAHSARIVGFDDGKLLGETQIESDGSFFLKVPSDRLLGVEIVDEKGQVLVRQGEGIWVRPNEHRGCIGCHEPRYLAPRNHFPLVLQKHTSEPAGPQGMSERLQKGER
jgi:hypothetical protein